MNHPECADEAVALLMTRFWGGCRFVGWSTAERASHDSDPTAGIYK
jgi:hypothetical protein